MMTPLKEWLKPPRSLLIILFLLTLVSVSALGWFGWKLLEQERVVEAQRAQDRVEQAADRIAATMRGTLAETGERLGAWAASPPSDGKPDEGLLLILTESSLAAFPPERLLYRPFPSPEPEAAPDLFAEGEVLEFQQSQPVRALEWYRNLAQSKDPAVRAGALMRMGRVLRKTAPGEPTRKVYAQLAAIHGVRVAGAPAELVGWHALCELPGRPGDTEALKAGLLGARWHLTRGQFEYYWSEASRMSGREASPPAEPVALAEAASLAWGQRMREPNARGQGIVLVDGRPFFLIWRGSTGRRAVLVTRPDSMMKPALAGNQFFVAAVDSDGRALAGQYPRPSGSHRTDLEGRGYAVRTAAESQLPWTLYVTGSQSALDGGMLTRQRFLLLGISVMVLFLIAGTYFIARAIRREMEVSRMQSDFVSAVSHEFRSPLTSIRQLSEILMLGRVPNEERRHIYYETLVRETARLQRLVESLLNFGHMEAGARQYRFEELEAATLVERVVGEFAPQIAGAGRQIEVHGAGLSMPARSRPRGALRGSSKPGGQCAQVLAELPHCMGGMGGSKRICGDPRARSRSGHSSLGTQSHLPEVRTRNRVRGGECERLRSWPGHGAPYRGGPWGHDQSGQRTRPGEHVYHAAARGGAAMTRILVVEDEPGIALGLEDDLKMEGYEVETVGDGVAATRRARETAFDLILLDVMLPGKDGFEVCRELRHAGLRTPILMLTAKTQEAEKVMGLELGADDYVTKPFGTRELRARIKALLRRGNGEQELERCRFGDVEVDFQRGELRRAGNAVDLTPIEFKLLALFIRARGRVLSRDRLLAGAWGPDTFASERIVDNHIVNLRRKIEQDPANPRYLRNVRGLGYRFDG